jgi:electron transfer flavoprotein alpha/beta subunit
MFEEESVMRIVACFKVVPEFESLTYEEVDRLIMGFPPDQFIKRIISPFDEAALEQALQLKQDLLQCGAEVHVTAVTAGICHSRFFQELYAVGFDQVVNVIKEGFPNPSAWETADMLAQYFAQGPLPDIVIMGGQADPFAYGVVPPIVDTKLGYSVFDHVFSIQPEAADDALLFRLDCIDNKVSRSILVKAPVVCMMEQAKHPYLRAAKLRDRLRAAKKETECFFAENALTAEPFSIKTMQHANKRIPCKMIEKQDDKAYAQFLLQSIHRMEKP